MKVQDVRHNGRTRRMLDQAVEAARERGEYILVVAANMRHVEILYARLLEYEGAEPTNPRTGKVYFRSPSMSGEVSVIAPKQEYGPSGFDWYTGTALGVHPSVTVLADHYALEQQMGWMLEHWLKWHEPSDFRHEYPVEYKL